MLGVWGGVRPKLDARGVEPGAWNLVPELTWLTISVLI